MTILDWLVAGILAVLVGPSAFAILAVLLTIVAIGLGWAVYAVLRVTL